MVQMVKTHRRPSRKNSLILYLLSDFYERAFSWKGNKTDFQKKILKARRVLSALFGTYFNIIWHFTFHSPPVKILKYFFFLTRFQKPFQ